MGTVVNNNKNYEELVQAVTTHLNCIEDVLIRYSTQQVNVDNSTIAREMKKLTDKIKLVEAESAKTKKLLAEERRRSNTDSLTGLPNRSSYKEQVFHELRRFRRYHRPLVMAICDIDAFKDVNEKFGKQVGDKALKLIAKVIKKRIRTVDFVARTGGDEFFLLMPETTSKHAYKVLEKVRSTIAAIPFKFNGKPVRITISIGVTEFSADDSMDMVFKRADQALLVAKTHGRNRCCIENKKNKNNVIRPKIVHSMNPSGISREISFK